MFTIGDHVVNRLLRNLHCLHSCRNATVDCSLQDTLTDLDLGETRDLGCHENHISNKQPFPGMDGATLLRKRSTRMLLSLIKVQERL